MGSAPHIAASLNLDLREGWPAELRVLLDRYPREAWGGHANLGQMARFWLERHAGFRQLGGVLQRATADFREGRLVPDAFRAFFAPRLQHFLGGLEGHHQIEDMHYFPIFRAADARLARGFDALEGDHESIHAGIIGLVASANGLLWVLDGPAEARRAPTDAYAEASERLLGVLIRHLDDEEDLLIPLILDQGERRLLGEE